MKDVNTGEKLHMHTLCILYNMYTHTHTTYVYTYVHTYVLLTYFHKQSRHALFGFCVMPGYSIDSLRDEVQDKVEVQFFSVLLR